MVSYDIFKLFLYLFFIIVLLYIYSYRKSFIQFYEIIKRKISNRYHFKERLKRAVELNHQMLGIIREYQPYDPSDSSQSKIQGKMGEIEKQVKAKLKGNIPTNITLETISSNYFIQELYKNENLKKTNIWNKMYDLSRSIWRTLWRSK